MSYGRIRRGPMAADNFTQIANSLFRDPRLSAKAKGIFGFISTHRDGWGVTPESIAAAMKDGVSSIKAGLQELERYGYLVRHQDRRADGTLGPISYAITDRPSSEPVDENRLPGTTCEDIEADGFDQSFRRSEPVDGYPLAADPTAENRPHKKTIPQNINSKNTPSPSPSRTSLELVPDVVEDQGGGGGGDASQQKEKQDPAAASFVDSLPYRGRIPGPRQRDHLIRRVGEALAAGWSENKLRVQLTEETDSAKSLAAVYRHRLAPENLPAAPPLPKPRTAADGPLSEASGNLYVKCQGPACGRKMLPTPDGLCRDCREDVTA